MTTTAIGAGERCPTCGRRVPKPRTSKTTTAWEFPGVIPAPSAMALHEDHLRRREQGRPKPRQGRYEHPDDYRFRREYPELVRFLDEAEAGGRVTRFYAATEPGEVVLVLAGPRGVFHPIPAMTVSVATIEEMAPRIVDGTAWQAFEAVEVAA